MNTSYYLTVSKLVSLITLVAVLSGCKSGDSETKNNSYLGYPKENSISIRVNPSFLLENGYLLSSIGKQPALNNQRSKAINSNPENQPDTGNILSTVTQIIGSNPNTEALLVDHYKELSPDFSKNMVLGADVVKNGGYAFIYLTFNGIEFLTSHLKGKNITERNNFQYAFLDESLEAQSVIVFDSSHVLLIGHQGSKEQVEDLIKSATYADKSTFVDYYKSTFPDSKEDLAFYLTPSENLLSKIEKSLLRDLLSSSNFRASFSVDNNIVNFKIRPTEEDFLLDSLLNVTTHQNTGIASFASSINLKQTKSFLQKYNLLGSIEHELKKAKISYEELTNIFSGKISLNYNGLIKTKQKTITYDYDDNFNEIEKISYTYSNSHDFAGLVGLANYPESLNIILQKKWLVANKKGGYELLALSKSKIRVKENELQIGEIKKEMEAECKLFLGVNDPRKLAEDLKISQLKKNDYLNSATLILDDKNELSIKLNLNDNFKQLLESLKALTSVN